MYVSFSLRKQPFLLTLRRWGRFRRLCKYVIYDLINLISAMQKILDHDMSLRIKFRE